jgi:hypothetical protein
MVMFSHVVWADHHGDWEATDRSDCVVWNDGSLRDAYFLWTGYTHVTWTGGCADGKADGLGILTWHFLDGAVDRYDGVMEAGMIHGPGTLTLANGDRLDGNWRNNLLHGQAVAEWASGERYDGEWYRDTRHGQGSMMWKNGAVYRGEWRHGLMQGYSPVAFNRHGL